MKHTLRSIGHVAGLWALAVAQPVLDVLGRSPEFLVAHRAEPIDIGLLVLLVAGAVPLGVALAILVASAAGRRAEDLTTASAVGLLAGLASTQIAYRLGVTSWAGALPVGLAIGALVIVAWLRTRPFRTFCSLLIPAAVVVPLLFLWRPGIRPLLLPADSPGTGAAVDATTPVVLVVFDQLPLVSLLDEHGEINPSRHPHFRALARDGVWFRNATTVSDYTQWAVPAIVSGQFPRAGLQPTSGDYPQTLFTLLGRRYRMEVVEPYTSLCPDWLCERERDPRATRLARMVADLEVIGAHVLFPPDARERLPDVTQAWAGFASSEGGPDPADGSAATAGPGPDVGHITSTRDFIARIDAGDRQPSLYYLHSLVSHHPPRWLPTGQIVADRVDLPGLGRDGTWTDDTWAVTQHHQAHLLQAALADTIVGELVQRLREAGLYDRALVIITADHGASYRAGDRMRFYSGDNAGDILPIPLIVKPPATAGGHRRGTVDDRNVETVDLLPTIADVLGVTIPWSVDGRSALAAGPARDTKRLFFDDATREETFEPAEVVRLRQAARDRTVALFGSAAFPAASVPGTATLLGQPTRSFQIVTRLEGRRVRLDRPLALEDVALNVQTLPAQAAGSVDPEAGVVDDPAVLAVALNDEVVATTRTWRGRAEWAALLPVHRIRSGANHLEAFLIDPERPDVLIRSEESPRPIALNLALGEAEPYGVLHRGFHRSESAGGVPFRWTNGAATITVPVDPEGRPRTLTVEVLFSGAAGKRLQVEIDGCAAVSATLPAGRWSRTVELGRCEPPGYWAMIGIRSDTHVPEGSDNRRLGVALARVLLE